MLPTQFELTEALREEMGSEMYHLVEEMFPFCRSITGNGVRATLDVIRKHIPLLIHEVASGTAVYDWEVPMEWNIRGAYIRDEAGNTVIDFKDNNLHVLNYSRPIKGQVSLSELKSHVYTLEDQPDLIPYRTSYYQDNWGFCMSHNHLESLHEGTYEVCIDSELKPGYLTYGEYYIPGESQEEILISSHICHPSLANDNLSGIAVNILLAKYLTQLPKRKFSYRFVFAPGTIGAITWLALNRHQLDRIRHGLVVSLMGAPGNYVYKESRKELTEINEVMGFMVNNWEHEGEIDAFIPYGYDERQYCSPGFNLPVGSISKGRWGQFPEYHTSADNLDFVKAEELADSLAFMMEALYMLETNETYENLNPYCEPQLGKRGLYDRVSGSNMNGKHFSLALLWVLNQSDGGHSLVKIAEKSGLPYRLICQAAQALEEKGLIRPAIVQHRVEVLSATLDY